MSEPEIAGLARLELVTSHYLDDDQPKRPVELSPGRLLVSRHLRDQVAAVAQPSKPTGGGAR